MIKADKMQITKEDVKRIKKIAQKTADAYERALGGGFDWCGVAWIELKDAEAKNILEKAGLELDKDNEYYYLSAYQFYDSERNALTSQSMRLKEAVCNAVGKELKALGIDCWTITYYD